jgi:type IX secretion system PorP/SprF family membrane protein
MKIAFAAAFIILLLGGWYSCCQAQSIHFSQFYNAPMLLNPANTGLMPEYDYRAGLNYRNQWAVIPVPYNTFSAFADCRIGANRATNKKNWLGVGIAFFNDVAGDGNLSLMSVQGSLAYHLELSSASMISLGFSGAHASRSVNYDQLTFDGQWDGATFNKTFPNGEKTGLIQTQYNTMGVGLNFAYYPTDMVYCKLGVGVNNVNTPVESFYNSTNKIGMRPMANLDIFFNTGPVFVVNPSVYYATQSGATEIVAGSLFRANLGGVNADVVTQLILGGFLRLGDAAIGAIGFQYGTVQLLASYDFTISGLAPYNGTYGALEFSLIYQGAYDRHKYDVKSMLGCPRFF